MLLVVTACLFPLLYLTLELPKRIINDAIGAQSTEVEFMGTTLGQVQFLGILCLGFLLAVLAHGLLKMRINTMKGVLAERMLRRFRYTLIARILRFPSPYFERVSQGELVSMITAESEPMGGLMGDAISQPVLQAGQMLTILIFLFLQSVWFGLAACALIPLQAWLIPILQRQINQLNKSRIQQVRGLAAEIGETAAGASTLRANGGWQYRLAEITDRLGVLFGIRFEIYRKKFFMKFLNNFISQLTPFFFYSVGGFLVLQGQVTVGALVAALAAYKDLSSPWKELLAYYNQTQDMSLRWEVVTERFAPPGMVDETLMTGTPATLPRLVGDLVVDDVTVRDTDGNAVLDGMTLTVPRASVVGIAAPSEEDRQALADLLSREVLPAQGSVTLAGHDLSQLHQGVIAARIGMASSRPVMFRGSFGDNIMMPLKSAPERQQSADRDEALRAGNSGDLPGGNWLDPARVGLADTDALRDWWVELIDGLSSGRRLFRRGLDQRFDAADHPDLAALLVRLRPQIQQALAERDLTRHVHLFRRDCYNPSLPVAENLIFATPRQPITAQALQQQSEFVSLVRRLDLDDTLLRLTHDVIDMLRQIFGMDGTDHPLFRKLGIDPKVYETAVMLVDKSRDDGIAALSLPELPQVFVIPFLVSAEQVGAAFPEDIKARILDLRHGHSHELQATFGDLFAPLDDGAFAPGLTVLENAMFGKISDGAGARLDDIKELIADILIDNGARRLVLRLIYDVPIALGGANVPALFAEPLAFSRAAIKRPDLLVLEKALDSYDIDTKIAVHKTLRRLLPDTTLVYIDEGFASPEIFDLFVEIRQGRIVSEETVAEADTDSAASADLMRKMRALESSPLFSGLDRKQMRLLAFGARWYEAKAGDTVFLKGDQPKDGAYMLTDGQAGLYLPKDDAADELIVTVEPGTLVGELGLIRQEPRALSMVAETDITCLRIGEEEFLAVVGNDAATAYKLLQVVAGYVS
ncbi:MAG: ABC transporter transmembrane domain-containing protein [Marinibacterium sp.]|nr:ABC transporter transmembrane domain-containing protein [Marinibacterium sp.]